MRSLALSLLSFARPLSSALFVVVQLCHSQSYLAIKFAYDVRLNLLGSLQNMEHN